MQTLVAVPRGKDWQVSWGLERLHKTMPERVQRLFRRRCREFGSYIGDVTYTKWKRRDKTVRPLP